MAANPIPDDILALIDMGQDALTGATDEGAAIGLVHNTAATIGADLGQLKTTHTNRIAGLTTLATARDNVAAEQTLARKTIRKAVQILKPFLGEPGAAWIPTGLNTTTPSGPYDVEQLSGRLFDLATYFSNNPARESALTTPPVTVADITTRKTALDSARSARNSARSGSLALGTMQDNSVAAMKNRLRGLIGELDQLLGPISPLWAEFGLNQPGALTAPEVVTGLLASRSGNAVVLDWEDAGRAEWYHVFRAVGAGAFERIDAKFFTSDARLENQPAGELKFYVVAVNESGSGAPSQIVTVS